MGLQRVPFSSTNIPQGRIPQSVMPYGAASEGSVATTISGMDSMAVLEQNLNVARGFQPFGEREMEAIRERVRPLAADGRYELCKTTTKYDGKVGREQHHYPPVEKLPV